MKEDFGRQMDNVQNETSMVVCYCITIALHENFGLGGMRLNNVARRLDLLETENTELLMAEGRSVADKAREKWVEKISIKEFRVPQYTAPKNRKERQLLMAKNTAATISWQLYAKACMDVLGFGPDRMKRLYDASMANFKEFCDICNEDAYAAKRDPELAQANKTMAMERLRVAAQNALNEDLKIVDGEDEIEQQFQDIEKEFKERAAKNIQQKATNSHASKIFNLKSMGAKSPAEISKIFDQCFADTISAGRSHISS